MHDHTTHPDHADLPLPPASPPSVPLKWIDGTCAAVATGRAHWAGEVSYCSRPDRLRVSDFLRGGQPLCWQHRKALEIQLQRWMLGVDRLIVPTTDVLGDLPPALRQCCALVVAGDDLQHDLGRCGQWAALRSAYGGESLAVPLCIAHAAALAWAMRSEWNRDLATDSRYPELRPGWGWIAARDHRLAPPAWSPY